MRRLGMGRERESNIIGAPSISSQPGLARAACVYCEPGWFLDGISPRKRDLFCCCRRYDIWDVSKKGQTEKYMFMWYVFSQETSQLLLCFAFLQFQHYNCGTNSQCQNATKVLKLFALNMCMCNRLFEGLIVKVSTSTNEVIGLFLVDSPYRPWATGR